MKLRRLLKPLALATALFTLAVVPAMGYNPAARDAQRPRAGASLWIPRSVDFNSGYDSNGKAFMVFGFDWGSEMQHQMDLEGSEQAFEFNAKVDCNWAGVAWSDANQGYRNTFWDTDVPGAALPYEDTIYLDDCSDGTVSFGAGVANASALITGRHYYIRVGLDTMPNWPLGSSTVSLTLQTGTTFDINNPVFSYDNRDCAWTSGEVAAWNSATSLAAFQDRLDAGWCVWPDWNHKVVIDVDGLFTGQLKWYTNNLLYRNGQGNESFEENRPPAWGYGTLGGTSATRYCNDWTGAFQGACFVQFSGNGPAWIYQDTTVSGNGGYTNEVAVRCRDADGVCQFHLGILGGGGPGVDQYYYNNITLYNVGNPLQWYICRLDKDHNSTGNPVFNYHNVVRWEIVSEFGELLDIDYTFLGGQTEKLNPQKDGAPVGNLPDAGPSCTARNVGV